MEKTNFFYLLAALLFLLIALPLAQDLHYRDMLMVRAVVFSVLLLVGIWSLKGGGRLYMAGMVFVVAGIALSILTANLDALPLKYGAALAMLGFLTVAIIHTLRQVVFGTELDLNRLVGAICVFLLLGIIWAFAYMIVGQLEPEAFIIPETSLSPVSDQMFNLGTAIYYSFVNLTTLGSGDILPAGPFARTLSYFEAIIGQVYLVVLIARLVSLHVENSR